MVVGNDTLLYSPYKDYSISKMSQDKKIEDLRKRNGIQMESERFFSLDDNNLVLPDYGCFVIDTYKRGNYILNISWILEVRHYRKSTYLTSMMILRKLII